jgi:signal transduction histidine kinase
MHKPIPTPRSAGPPESIPAVAPAVAPGAAVPGPNRGEPPRELDGDGDLQSLAWIITHELLEPLRLLRLQTDQLTHSLRPAGDFETARAAAGRIQRQGADLWQRMNDVLAFMRVTTMTLQRQPVSAQAVAESVRTELRRRIQLANGVVQIDGLPDLTADETMLRQLFENLIDNALKFQPPGAHAVVRIRSERVPPPDPGEPGHGHAAWRLRVEDNGIGFDPRHTERIFQPFERLHAPGEYAGTGIGLAIARRIAERHGGTLEAEGAPGAGATFVITWPDPGEER